VLEHELRKVADGGDIDAMNLLGSFLHSWGRQEEAAGWYRPAAEARAASTMLSGYALAFLHESNAIEGITNIRYEATALSNGGHPGAFLLSQTAAYAKQPLSIEMICEWQRLITEEQVRFGHGMKPEGIGVLRGPLAPYDVWVGRHVGTPHAEVSSRMSAWVNGLNVELAQAGPLADVAVYARLLGDFFQSFEAIHPFIDGNGRAGRLAANYIATYMGRALLVFRSAESPAYYEAHRSRCAMRLFMAKQLRQAVVDLTGHRLELTSGHGLSSVYGSEQHPRQLIVEWHSLCHAEDQWRLEDAQR